MGNALLLIGTKPSVVETAKKLGFEVILFQRKSMFRVETLDWADECYVVDWKDTQYMVELAKVINQRRPIAAALAFGEESVLTAAYINEALCLEVNPIEAIEIAKDKYKMRDVMREKGLSPVEYRLCRNQADVWQAVSEIGFPLIAKPIQGTGSIGIYKMESEQQVQEYLQGHPETFSDPVLMEQFLIGEEFSVEGVSFDGEHQMIGITKKYTTGAPHFVETGHIMPAQLPERVDEEIKVFTREVLQAIGHRNGPSHTEVILTAAGPRLIETHTRPGGDRITDLINLSFGIDVFDLTMRWIRGENYPTDPAQKSFSAIRFLLLVPGKIESIVGMEEVRSHPNVVDFNFTYNIGDFVPQAVDSLHRHGHILFKAATQTELYHAIEKVSETLIIRTTAE